MDVEELILVELILDLLAKDTLEPMWQLLLRKFVVYNIFKA